MESKKRHNSQDIIDKKSLEVGKKEIKNEFNQLNNKLDIIT